MAKFGEDIRQFRHSVSVLKQQGLISGRIDARSAYPSWKSNGVKLSILVKRYDDIVSGKVTAVKVPEKKLRSFRSQGFETAKGRVLVGHGAGQTAKFEHGELTVKHPSGIQEVKIPVKCHNLEQYLSDIRDRAAEIDRQKTGRQWFGLQFYGNNSSELYRSVDQMIERLRHYESVERSIDKRSRAKQTDIYKNLVILKVPRAGEWQFPLERRREYKRSKQEAREYMKKWRKRQKRKDPAEVKRQADKSAERMRQYRLRLKRNKREYEQYLKEGRKRAKRSAKRRK